MLAAKPVRLAKHPARKKVGQSTGSRGRSLQTGKIGVPSESGKPAVARPPGLMQRLTARESFCQWLFRQAGAGTSNHPTI